MPTLSMFHHHNIKSSPLCNQCDDDNETFLHCVRECIHSRNLRLYLGSLLLTFLQLRIVASRQPSSQSHCCRCLVGLEKPEFSVFSSWKYSNLEVILSCLYHAWDIETLAFTPLTMVPRKIDMSNEIFKSHVYYY